ncbi:hypothetical protein B7992_15230 [Fibrobacter sp. UWH1]|nr:hypothetical protein B7992_15230 [Fibrobacter sp. UWH1]
MSHSPDCRERESTKFAVKFRHEIILLAVNIHALFTKWILLQKNLLLKKEPPAKKAGGLFTTTQKVKYVDGAKDLSSAKKCFTPWYS